VARRRPEHARRFADANDLHGPEGDAVVLTATLLTVANTFFGLGKVLNVEQSR
jgi:hypothetical protein